MKLPISRRVVNVVAVVGVAVAVADDVFAVVVVGVCAGRLVIRQQLCR